MALATYQKVNQRMYPTWTEVLEVRRALGSLKSANRTIHLATVPAPALTTVA